jgi:hypothetical protein
VEVAAMSGEWKEVVKLAFNGDRFRDHALDLSALSALSRFQKIVAETAKSLWRDANPERERIPKGFEERTRLCLRRIDPGSAVAPLEVYIEQPEEKELFELEPTEVIEAIDLAQRVYRAVENNEPLPDKLPKALVPEYGRFGQELADNESIKVIVEGEKPARVTSTSRSRLLSFSESAHESQADVTGEVLEADVRRYQFIVYIDDNTGVTVAFTPDQEDEVTSALKEHNTRRLRVKGKGEFSPAGKLQRITQVEEMQLQPIGEVLYNNTARPIEDILEELASEVPKRDWKKLPLDLTDNLDHYIYGTPKQ